MTRRLLPILLTLWLGPSPATADLLLTGVSTVTTTCPTAAAVYLAAITTPPAPFKSATCQLVTDLQTTGVWPTLDVAYILAGPSEAAAKYNLVAPSTFTLTKTGTPAFVAYAGYTGAAGSNYLDTTFNPSTASSPHLQLNSAALYAWRNTLPVNGQNLFGAHTGANLRVNEQGVTSTTSVPYAAINSATGGGGGTGVAVVGGIAGVRTVAGSHDFYFNGSYFGTTTATSSAVPNSPISILYASTQSVSTQISFASAGGALTEPGVYSLNASVARYLAAVNGTTPSVYPTGAVPIVGTRASQTATENPSLARLPDGTLMLVYLNTSINASPWTIGYATSPDGKTWTDQGILINQISSHQLSGPFLSVVGSTIFLTFWEANPGAGYALNHLWIGTSSGGVVTWDTKTTVTCTIYTQCSTGQTTFTYGRIVKAPNGTLLMPWYSAITTNGAFIMTSSNNGATWGNDTVIANSALVANDRFSEAYLTVLPNGSITAVVRNDNTVTTARTGYWQTTSTDNGTTWSAPTQISISPAPTKPGGQTLVATSSGGLFLLGRFSQTTPSAKDYLKAWMYQPSGGSWSASPSVVLGPQTTGVLNDGYSDCMWDAPTKSVLCALAFIGSGTEPTTTAGFIWQAQWSAQ